MGLIHFFGFLALLVYPSLAISGSWSGPQIVTTIPIGDQPSEVGFKLGDAIDFDHFPRQFGIVANGFVFIDYANGYFKSFNFDGTLVAVGREKCTMIAPYSITQVWCENYTPGSIHPIHPALFDLSTSQFVFRDTSRAVDPELLVAKGGTAWFGREYLYDSSGTLLTTTTSRPIDFGALRTIDSSTYEVEYPDRVYVYETSDPAAEIFGEIRRVGDDGVLIRDIMYENAGQIPNPAEGKDRYRLEKRQGIDWPEDEIECVADPDNPTTGQECTRKVRFGNIDDDLGLDQQGNVYTWKLVYPGQPNPGFYVIKWVWQP